MKLIVPVLALLVAVALATAYDPKNHHNGHELEVSIREDDNTVFVIMWYRNDADSEVSDLNNKIKTGIASKLSGMKDVSWSLVDMAIEDHHDTTKPDEEYSTLFETINGEEYSVEEGKNGEDLQKKGPVVNVIRKSRGTKITGQGIPDEVADQVKEFQEAIKKDQSSKASADSKTTDAANSGSSNGSNSNTSGKLDTATDPTQGDIDDIF